MRVGGQCHATDALRPGKTRSQLYRRLGGPQGRYGRVRKISPPPGFDVRTVQAVASFYIDWAIRPHDLIESDTLKSESNVRTFQFNSLFL